MGNYPALEIIVDWKLSWIRTYSAFEIILHLKLFYIWNYPSYESNPLETPLGNSLNIERLHLSSLHTFQRYPPNIHFIYTLGTFILEACTFEMYASEMGSPEFLNARK